MARRSKADDDLLSGPLTARSVIASLLLGRHPPSAPSALLVRWCGLFGISETTARVALTRMAQGGELAVTDGVYELAGRVRERQREQEFALAPEVTQWDGSWKVAVAPRGTHPAVDRVERRRTMVRMRMAVLREGVWIRPDNLPHDARLAMECTWLRGARLGGDAPDVTVLFDVDRFARRSAALLERLRAVTAALPEAEVLAEGFVVGAAVAQHLRRDPLLPGVLLPASWRGDVLRVAYREYERAFGRAVRRWSASG